MSVVRAAWWLRRLLARAAWAARALLRLCVLFVFLRALLAARVRCWRVVFVFLARVVGGRCVGAGAALRFVSGARCARAVFVFVARVAGCWCVRAAGAGCVCFSGARRGRAVRGRWCGGAFCFLGARRGRAVRVCFWGAAFFFCGASRAGGACVLLVRGVLFFAARRGRALLGRAFLFFRRAPLAIWTASPWSVVARLGAPRAAVWVFSVLRRGGRRCSSAARIRIRVH